MFRLSHQENVWNTATYQFIAVIVIIITIIIIMSFPPTGKRGVKLSDDYRKKTLNVSYLLSIIGSPWQKGGHMKHDFSSMELCIHRMFTSGVICQSNFQMSDKFRK